MKVERFKNKGYRLSIDFCKRGSYRGLRSERVDPLLQKIYAMRRTPLFLNLSILFLFISIAACTQKKTLYTYGAYSISEIDCGQRELVVRVLHPDRKILNGCEELKTVFENIAKKNIIVTPEMLTQYETQLEKRFPKEKRDKIKKIFGPDKESYQKIYLITESVTP